MLNELAKEIHKNNIEKGFYEKPKNIGEMLCLIHSEVSEALEADRKGKHCTGKLQIFQNNTSDLNLDRHDEARYYNQEFETAVKNTFEDELADIMIRVLDLAEYKGIDLSYHIAIKMRYNAMREKYHGKKY